jgi:hypothetical protein
MYFVKYFVKLFLRLEESKCEDAVRASCKQMYHLEIRAYSDPMYSDFDRRVRMRSVVGHEVTIPVSFIALHHQVLFYVKK